MSFNPDEFFAKQRAQENLAFQVGHTDREIELEIAAKEKALQLQQAEARRKMQEEDDKRSLVSVLGLDPNSDVGSMVNTGASTLAGFSQYLIGNMAALPSDVLATLGTLDVTDEERQAYARYKQKTATPKDMQTLSRRRFMNGAVDTQTTLDRLDTEDQQRAVAQGARDLFNIDYLKHDGNAQKLSADLSKTFQGDWDNVKTGWAQLTGEDKLDGLLKLSKGLGSLVVNAVDAGAENPMAVTEYVAQNVPQLAMGASRGAQLVLGATNISYAYDNYNKGIEAYKAANDGAYPPEDIRQQIASVAATLALAEQVGDVTALKTVFGGAKKAATETAEAAAKTTVLKSAAEIAKAGTVGAATEAATEGYQTFAEGLAQQKLVDAQQIYEGAVIGGLAGGGLSTGGRTVDEAVKLAKEGVIAAEKSLAERQASLAQKTEDPVKKAIETGDVSVLTDPASPQYAPERAISVLQAWATAQNTTEAWEKAEADAQKIADSIEVERINTEMAARAYSPEGQAELQTDLNNAIAIRDAMVAKNHPGLADQELEVQELQSLIAEVQKNGAPVVAEQQQKIKALAKQAEVAKTMVASLQQAKQAKTEPLTEAELSADDTAISAKEVEIAPAEAPRAITLAMRSPEKLSAAQATRLAQDPNSNLLPEQRQYLSAYAVARGAEASLDTQSVHHTVLYGDPANLGLKQHRAAIVAALNSGSPREVKFTMGRLERFYANHMDKLNRPNPQSEDGSHAPSFINIVKNEQAAIKALIDEMTALKAAREAQAANPAQSQASTSKASPAAPQGASQAPVTEEKAPAPAPKTETTPEPKKEIKKEIEEGPAEPVQSEKATLAEAPVPASMDTEEAMVAKEPTSSEAQKDVQPNTNSAKAPSGLRVMGKKTPKGTPYRKRHLLADFFIQKPGASQGSLGRPLVVVRDFLSQVMSQAVSAKDFLESDNLTNGGLTDKQKRLWGMFVRTAVAWRDEIKANLPKLIEKEETRTNELLQYFLEVGPDGQVDVEENFKTAMAFAAFSVMLELANEPSELSNSAINKVLGRQDEDPVSEHAFERLSGVGKYQHKVRAAIGNRMLGALGIQHTENAPKDVALSLPEILGAHGLRLLQEHKFANGNVGFVTRHEVSGKIMAELMAEGRENFKYGGDLKADHIFISIRREKNGKLPAEIQEFLDANKGTKGILESLFKSERNLVAPRFKPNPKAQANPEDSKMAVPTPLADIVVQNQSNPRKLRRDLWSLMTLFTEEEQHALLGVKKLDPTKITARNLRAIKAKNNALLREWELFNEFVEHYLMDSEKGLQSDFFLEFSVWKQQRVGIKTNMVNPQTSKTVRFLIGSPAWEATIDSTNDEHVTSFWLRVAEGLGRKTETEENSVSVKAIQEQIKTEPYASAIKALIKALVEQEELSDAECTSILEAVGSKRMHGLDALVAVAYQQAAESAASGGPYTFKTQLMGEVDGVANGTILNHILYGASHSAEALLELLKRGGIYTTEDVKEGLTNFNLWKSSTPLNLDIYQVLARRVFRGVQELYRHFNNEQLAQINSIWKMLGNIFNEEKGTVTKEGRDLMKNGVNPLAFGSSMKRVKSGMANALVDAVYAGFEKIAADSAHTQADVNDFVEHVNRLIASPKLALPLGKPLAFYMKQELSSAQERNIREAFNDVVGGIAEEVFNEEFAPFVKRRTQMTELTGLLFNFYDVVYKGMRKQFVEELVKKGVIEKTAPTEANPEGALTRDLTFAEEEMLEKRLQKIAPMLDTFFSKKDMKKLNSGLFSGKYEVKPNYTSLYSRRARFGRGVASQATYAQVLSGVAPGVNMMSANTHSADSAISHLTQSQMDVLNIHDAVATGVLSLKDAAKLMNQHTWEVMLEMSPLQEAYLTLERQIYGLAQLARDGEFDQETKTNLMGLLKADSSTPESMETALLRILAEAKHTAYLADVVKLQAMAQWAVVDQYAFQGGQYTVTPEDRAVVQEKLSSLSPELTPEIRATVKALVKAYNNNQKPAPVLPQEAETAQEAVPASPGNVDPNPGNQQGVESTLEEDRKSFWNGLEPAHLVQMANAFKRGIANPKISPKTQEMLREWLVLLQQGKLMWAGVESRLDGLEIDVAQDIMSVLEEADEYWEEGQSLGTLGNPLIQPNAELMELFQKNPEPSVKEVLHTLMQHYRNQPSSRMQKFNMELLMRVWRLLPENLSFMVIRPDTNPVELLDIPVGQSYGWFSSTSSSNTIYVMGEEFLESNLNPDMLLHELVHGALARVIDNELQSKKKDPKYTSAALALVEELETLRQASLKYATNAGLEKAFDAALADVQEFVAWGMTNQAFQRQVLNNVTMESKNFRNRLVSGVKDFIRTVVGILFQGSDKSRQDLAENGMALLISNVSGLLAEVSTQRNSTQKQRELTFSMASSKISQYTTADVLHSLMNKKALSDEFKSHLENVLADIVTRLHGPFGTLHAQLNKGVSGDPADVWLNALKTGTPPFTSQVIASPFAVSDAELFMIEQVEAAVKVALEGDTESQASFPATELRKLFVEMRNNLVRGQDLTEKQYDFLFKVEAGPNGKSEYLSRFAAMVLAHEEVRKLADVATQRTQISQFQNQKMSISEQVQRWFIKLLDFFTSKLAGTSTGSPGHYRARQLVQRLVEIEARRKHQLKHPVADFIAGPLELLEKAGEKGRSTVKSIVDSDWTRNRAFLPVRVVGKTVSIFVNDRVEASIDGFNKIRDKAFASKHGIASSLMNELVGHREKLLVLLRHTKLLENTRKDVIAGNAKAALAAFANGNALTKAQKHGITQVFLRSGAHSLLNRFSPVEIINMVSDNGARKVAMAQLESELMAVGGVDLGYYWWQQAEYTGYYKARGRNVSPLLMMNAHNIAALYGTDSNKGVTADQFKKAVPLIEMLIALNAIDNVKPSLRSLASGVAIQEAKRGTENGVEFLLKMHAKMDREARMVSFKGKEALMVHGFTPEIFNPHVEVVIADAAKKREMELHGYKMSHAVTPPPGEIHKEPQAVYVLRGAGMAPYLSGIAAINSDNAKGTLLVENGVVTQFPQYTPGQAMIAVQKARAAQIAAMFAGPPKVSPRDQAVEYSAPLLNASGSIVNFRTLMHEETKDTLLERENGFEHVIGSLAGSLFDQEQLPSHNKELVQALHGVYTQEYPLFPESFLLMGPGSTDPQMKEHWRRLSPAAREEALRLFGKEGMWVPKNAVDLVMGYRKPDLGSVFAKDPAVRKWYEEWLVTSVEWMLETYATQRLLLSEDDAKQYAKRARVIVSMGDRMWQELVREIKDIVVVKTGLTLLGNMTSNWLQLWAEGLSWVEIFRYTQIALRSALDHRKDSQKLGQLEGMLSAGYVQGDAQEIQSEINRLRDKIQRNPVHADIEAGLMPSIVEDVQDDVDPYSYKSALTEAVQSRLDKLGKVGTPMRNVARYAYMTKDTWMYQSLSRMTQLSDFTARHALRQHLMNRKKNPLGADEATAIASKAFINYDIPMHPLLQALDDRGLLLFTKYVIRIQPVLLRLLREKPARMITMMLANGWVDTGPIITDSGLFNRIGNPLEPGAFGIFDALNETATVAGAIALID